MSIRRYGSSGPWVVLVHGGPGTGGYMAPLAHALQDDYRVLEPLQRGSGPAPLTVAVHVADLDAVVREHCTDARPVLVGHSWGAMLALAYAAAHPHTARGLVLVGCGTFDPASRRRLAARIDERLAPGLGRRIARLAEEVPDPDERLRTLGTLILPAYSYDEDLPPPQLATCDARAHEETWRDMLRLQDEGLYPQAFAAITAPVLMAHGAADPHPGRSIAATLRRFLPQLEYREWKRCGHYPWLESGVRDEFFATLRAWLSQLPMPGSRSGPPR